MAELVLSDIKKIKGISPYDKLLLDEIVFRTQTTGYCWASNKKLLELVGQSLSTLSRSLRKLEKLGFILREESRSKDNKYFVSRKIYVFVENILKATQEESDVEKSTPKKPKANKSADKKPKKSNKPSAKEQKDEEPESLGKSNVVGDANIDPVTGEVFDVKPKTAVSLVVEVMLKKRFGIELTEENIKSILKLEKKYDVDEFVFAINNSWNIKVDYPIPYLAASLKKNRTNGSYAAYVAKQEREEKMSKIPSIEVPTNYYHNWMEEDFAFENSSNEDTFTVLVQDEDYQTAIEYKQTNLSDIYNAIGIPAWNPAKNN